MRTMTVREGPRSVDRLIDLLDLFAQDRTAKSLSELSLALDAPKTSLFSLLGSMSQRQMLVRNASGRYELGPAAIRTAINIVASSTLTDITHPHLVRLAKRVGETALLGCLEPQLLKAIYVDKAESESAVRYTVPLGQTRELHCSSLGKVILAFCPDVAATVFKSARLARRTKNTITDKEILRRQLNQIRKTGVSRTVDEATDGAAAMATPILSRTGKFVAGLVIAGPTQRFLQAGDRIERELATAARAITSAMPEGGSIELPLSIDHLQRNAR